MTGLLQGNFPDERSFSDVERNGVEEERRLAYVAFTRARERLIITRPQRYRHQRAWQVNPERSMFWTEVPKQLRASSLSRSQRNRRPVPRTTSAPQMTGLQFWHPVLQQQRSPLHVRSLWICPVLFAREKFNPWRSFNLVNDSAPYTWVGGH